MKMATLTLYGGIDEIGGNKILLQDRDTKVFFDFGESFTSGCDFFVDWLSPRNVAGLRDYFEFGLLPKIPGLYSRKALRFTDLKYREPQFDAVFISHPHFDHIAHLDFVDESIPVHMSNVGRAIIEAWGKSTPLAKFGEHDYRPFEPGRKIKVGSLEVVPMNVDHSIPGACGFIVHTSEGSIVYTGDFRKHGVRAGLTLEFLERAADERPVAMISEGTRVAPREDRKYVGGEDGVRRESDKVISGTDKLVVATFYGRDVDRMNTFAAVAKENGREFVVSTRAALLLTTLEREGVDVPKLGRDFLVYARRKETGGFEEADYFKWERPFIKDAVNFEHIHRHQGKVLLNLDFYHFAELVDIQPDPGGHFIHSMSEPVSEEDLEAEVMRNWLKHFGLRFHQVHSSGHISREEVFDAIGKVGPRCVIPVHTEGSEIFRKELSNVTLPKYGEPIKL
jgi:ribonuclease J